MEKKDYIKKISNEIIQKLDFIDAPLEPNKRHSLLIEIFHIFLKSKSKNKKFLKKFNNLVKNDKAFLIKTVDLIFRSKKIKKTAYQLSNILRTHRIPRHFSFFIKLKLFIFKLSSKKLNFFISFLIKKTFKKNFFAKFITLDKRLKKSISFLNEERYGEKNISYKIKRYIRYLSYPHVSRISIKLSTISNTSSFDVMLNTGLENLKKIFQKAKELNKEVILEMENYKYFHLTFELFKKITDEFKEVKASIFLQSYLPDSFNVLKELISISEKRKKEKHPPLKVYIVKGKYFSLEEVFSSKNNYKTPTFLTKISTDANFKKMILFALDKEINISICTHNLFDIIYFLIVLKERNIRDSVDFSIREKEVFYETLLKELLSSTKKLNLFSLVAKDINETVPFFLRKIETHSINENFIKHLYKSYKSHSFEQLENQFLKSIKEIENVRDTPRQEEIKENNFTLFSNFENEKRLNLFSTKKKDLIEELKIFSPKPISLKKILKEKELDAIFENIKPFEKINFLSKKKQIFLNIANSFREKKIYFIKLLASQTLCTIEKAEEEVSKLIDSIEYQIRRLEKLKKFKDLSIGPKGICLISSSIYFLYDFVEMITASLLAKNATIIRADEKTLPLIQEVLNVFYKEIPKESLKLIFLENELFENFITKNKNISSLFINDTKENILKYKTLAPSLKIYSYPIEKSVMIITSFKDMYLAIKNIKDSAFSFSGQSIFSTKAIILEKEVFENKSFRKNLIDTILSLKAGSNLELHSSITPLLHTPKKNILNLNKKESWLIKPTIKNNLMTPGIKISTKIPSLSLTPILTMIKANDLNHALQIFKEKKSSLLSIQSLDEKEHIKCKKSNTKTLFINKKTTTYIRKTPFSTSSSYKKGGPNFLVQFANISQKNIPQEKSPIGKKVNELTTSLIQQINLSTKDLGIWYASIANYSYWAKKMKVFRDPSKIIGEDNFFGYFPIYLIIRIEKDTKPLPLLRKIAAALSVKTKIEISIDKNEKLTLKKLSSYFNVVYENEKELKERAFLKRNIIYANKTTLVNGRYELINYLKEITISYNYHRYGTLQTRGNELRKPVK